MKNYIDYGIKKANSRVARTAEKIISKYDRQIENRKRILNEKYLYILKGISYIEKPNKYHVKLINSAIQINPYLDNIRIISDWSLFYKDTSLEKIGGLSLDGKKRFRLWVSNIPFRRIAKSLPQCKTTDKKVFIIQNSLNIIKYLYVYIFLNQVKLTPEAEKEIKKLLLLARNKEVRKISFYNRVHKANLIKRNPIRKMEYYSKIPLWYHQRRAIHMGCTMNEYNYVMEQRTGKTLVNSCIAAIRHEWGQVNRVLVVGPISCFEIWRESFTQNIKCITTFFEIKDERPLTTDELVIGIINFESVKSHIKIIKDFNPDMVIVDEGHKIANKSSNQSKAIHKLSFAKYRYNNTGTPIEGDKLQDMWSQYRFLIPELLGRTYISFSDKYLELGRFRDVIGYKREKELLRKIHDTSFVLSYEECFGDDDIPHISEYGQLSDICREIYNSMDEDLYVEVDDIEIEAKIVLSKMIKLQQIAGGFIVDNEGETIELGDGKLSLLYDVLLDRKLLKVKTVIFARFNTEIWAINNYLNNRKIKTLVLTGKDGDGKKRTKEDREEILSQFNEDKSVTHIIVQIKIAKEAIDLSVADNEIFYSNGFSYKDYDQAKKRIRNANKNRPINCINLLMEDTIDEVIMTAMNDKKNVTLEYFYKHQRDRD